MKELQDFTEYERGNVYLKSFVAQALDCNTDEAQRYVDAVGYALMETLSKGCSVKLKYFGSVEFRIKKGGKRKLKGREFVSSDSIGFKFKPDVKLKKAVTNRAEGEI